MSIEFLDCLKREQDIYIKPMFSGEKRGSGVPPPYSLPTLEILTKRISTSLDVVCIDNYLITAREGFTVKFQTEG